MHAGLVGGSLTVFFLGMLGCSADSDQRVPCRSEHTTEVEALEDAVSAMDGFVAQHRTAIAESCAAIAEDLGAGSTVISAQATSGELEDACTKAASALEGADYTVTQFTPGTCDPDSSVEAACLAACGTTAVCEGACEAKALLSEVCTLPTLSVSSGNPAVVATLEQHLPAIYGLGLASATFSASTVALPLAISFSAQWVDESCDQDVERIGTVFERLSSASDEWLSMTLFAQLGS